MCFLETLKLNPLPTGTDMVFVHMLLCILLLHRCPLVDPLILPYEAPARPAHLSGVTIALPLQQTHLGFQALLLQRMLDEYVDFLGVARSGLPDCPPFRVNSWQQEGT
jgi:hypothetical protein